MEPRLADHIFMYRLTPVKLDKLLATGYFRNANIMFQSQVLCLEGNLCNVLNVRLPLKGYSMPKRMAKIWRRGTEKFRIEIKRAEITPEKSELYHKHRKRFKGFQFRDLEQLLYGDSPVRVFDTFEVNVYDNERLVAYSFFDAGQKSLASILGVFDEAYASYSLGIFTMLAEINWALLNDYKFYYPGYVLDQTSQFDYKLKLGKFSYYLWDDNAWGSKDELEGKPKVGQVLLTELNKIIQILDHQHIKYELKLYPFFSLGYLSLANYQFYVKSPIHIFLPEFSTKGKFVLMEFDTEDKRFVYGVARINEQYRQYLKEHHVILRQRCPNEWGMVLEYNILHKYTCAESLMYDFMLTHKNENDY